MKYIFIYFWLRKLNNVVHRKTILRVLGAASLDKWFKAIPIVSEIDRHNLYATILVLSSNILPDILCLHSY